MEAISVIMLAPGDIKLAISYVPHTIYQMKYRWRWVDVYHSLFSSTTRETYMDYARFRIQLQLYSAFYYQQSKRNVRDHADR